MIKVVLLDYGRVVAPEDADPVVQAVYGASADDEASNRLFGLLRRKLALGQVDEADVKYALEDQGLNVNEDYVKRWYKNINEHMYPVPEMIELVEQLKGQGYQVALLSNVWPLSMKIIRENGWYNYFDKLYLSCEMHMAKPDANIYDAVVQDLGVAPSEIMFVDDKQVNLEYPATLGMKTLLVDSPVAAVIAIRQALVS